MRRAVQPFLIVALLCAAPAARGEIVYRCAANLCGINSDGSAGHTLTTFGTPDTPVESPSGTAAGDRLAFVMANTAYVVSFPGKHVTDLRVNTALAARIRPDGTRVAVINEQQEAGGSLVPWLVTVDPDGSGYANESRFVITAGWLGETLLRDGTSTTSSAQAICALASTGTCAANVADDPQRNLYDPSAAPDLSLIAATAAPLTAGATRGDIALFDPASGALVRDLTTEGDAGHPAFSPDGRLVAFDRADGWVYVIPTAGGAARRVAQGDTPTWLGPDVATVRCRVPQLAGQKLAAARKLLRTRHCTLGTVRRRAAAQQLRGRVVKQSPAAGTRRPAGSAVNVTLGK